MHPCSLHGCGFDVNNSDFLDFLSSRARPDHGIVHSRRASTRSSDVRPALTLKNSRNKILQEEITSQFKTITNVIRTIVTLTRNW
jgi:hypothetical protein